MYDWKPLNYFQYNKKHFYSPCLLSFFFFSLRQYAGLVSSSRLTISPRCALPSCCSTLIKELLNEWLRCAETLVANNISLTEAQSCMLMAANKQRTNLTHNTGSANQQRKNGMQTCTNSNVRWRCMSCNLSVKPSALSQAVPDSFIWLTGLTDLMVP